MGATPGVIGITRLATRWRDRGLRYRVLVDGEPQAVLRPREVLRPQAVLRPREVLRPQAVLRPRESARLECSSGHHLIQIRGSFGRAASHPLELDLQPGAVISLVCETGGSARRGLRDHAEAGFDAWITLRTPTDPPMRRSDVRAAV